MACELMFDWTSTRETALTKSGRLLRVESDPEAGWAWCCQHYRAGLGPYQLPVTGLAATKELAREAAIAMACELDAQQGVAPGGAP